MGEGEETLPELVDVLERTSVVLYGNSRDEKKLLQHGRPALNTIPNRNTQGRISKSSQMSMGCLQARLLLCINIS
jgi:hypothetical protein